MKSSWHNPQIVYVISGPLSLCITKINSYLHQAAEDRIKRDETGARFREAHKLLFQNGLLSYKY